MIFDTLYGIDSAYKAQPQMVAGHTVENDGKLVEVTLRDGLNWHDGTPVLARDCTPQSSGGANAILWANFDGCTPTSFPPPTTRPSCSD